MPEKSQRLLFVALLQQLSRLRPGGAVLLGPKAGGHEGRLFHHLLMEFCLVLRFRGRNTGRQFSIPVSYDRQGATLHVYTRHAWWKNLRSGVPVEVVLRGRLVEAYAEAVSNPAEVTAAVTAFITSRGPAQAWQIAVALAPDRVPTPAALAAACRGLVLVRVHLPGVP